MSFYSIILDWDYGHNNPFLRLVVTSPDEPPLETVSSWDPAGSYSTIDRTSFQVTKIKPHNLKNQYDGTVNAAHICRVTAT